ncbi:unnamed protein product (macronuclear) [Paramecium tetraurelia]|uniref:Protein kinase domain-containing protein n=1 Tax=Paramecium tetraurelia TaxID=5888 RepID=A0BEX8_PARTE|nr:uncharacterized protein GSPATT00028130001 [Paramecium tetraurelia]CAK57095.1 unnamed protein product [Paramecium tetraurelia]|eukprot:XP_001424493.1 hypothetical protein (macronuclear) [Paramecium tetraurelia strain d4-2]
MSIPKFTLSKQVRFCTLISLNCNPLCLLLNQNTKFSDIMKLIKISWRRNLKFLRLFKPDGTEVEEKDLINIKRGTTLYAELSNEDLKPNIIQQQYDIIKKIGEGGQGIVLLGKHKITKESVALKIISLKTWLGQEIDGISQEQSILNALDHKNIVKLHQSYVTQNQREITMVLEYLNGGSLLNQANSKLSEADAKLYSKQIVDAIAYCHQNSIVHCDLKLENIMLTSPNSKEIKIIDFGVSSYAGQLKLPDSVVGTLSYLAPEVLSPSYKCIQPSQDVLAVGCIIYGLVFGRLPFDGANPSETYRNIIQCNYSIPKKSVSKDLIHLLSQIFVNPPKERANIFDIQNHSWFKEQPILFKLSFRNGRSSSVTKLNSYRQQQDEDQIILVSQRKNMYHRRSVTRQDKVLFFNKIK